MGLPKLNQTGTQWLNIDKAIEWEDLKGKFVILDFWTFCCINCIHVLPTLKKIEQAFPEDVVVLGIHSPKFSAEKDPENVKKAIQRYDIEHPVLQDAHMQLWQQFAIRAWPTLAFVNQEGQYLGQQSGEPDVNALYEFVQNQIQNPGLNTKSFLIENPSSENRFSFPGKIKPMTHHKHIAEWAICDSGHHQICLLDEAGKEIFRIGTGDKGLIDGSFDEVHFNNPQGLIDTPYGLFIADTDNHAIRKIDFENKRVMTCQGNGIRGGGLPREWETSHMALASPWDLEIRGDEILFANAGTHQLGRMKAGDFSIQCLAGSGGENIDDGYLYHATLAQTSGLAYDQEEDNLYFVDSETSSLRVLDFAAEKISTLIGTGLFDFGTGLGSFKDSQFQHALGLCLWQGNILIVDSYNHRICLVDKQLGLVSEWSSTFQCQDPVCMPLFEPAGVTTDGERVLVSDTNNHRILEYFPKNNQYKSL